MIEDKRDLEKTSTSLVTKLTELKESTLKRRITEAEEDRVEILNKHRQSRRALYEALEAEKCKYSDHPIAYNNEEYKLDELAQWLHENDDTADIIPGPVSGNVVPLTADEMKRLYSTNGRWTADQITYFKSDRLAAVDFPKPEELSFQFDREKETRKELDGYGIEEQKTLFPASLRAPSSAPMRMTSTSGSPKTEAATSSRSAKKLIPTCFGKSRVIPS